MRPSNEEIMKSKDYVLLRAMHTNTITKYKWEAKRSFLPRNCALSGASIRMFSIAYMGIREIYGIPGESPAIWIMWMTPTEYLIQKIKNTI